MEGEVFTVVSSNGEEFRIPIKVALQSEMIASLIAGTQATYLRLDGKRDESKPEITSDTLRLIIEFCTHHVDDAPKEPAKIVPKPGVIEDEWDKQFVSEEKLNQKALFDLTLAANYLDIKKLVDLTCKGIANRIQDMSPQEIIKYFKAVYPFDAEYTPEEEAAVRAENPWIDIPQVTPPVEK